MGDQISGSEIKLIPCCISSVQHRNDYQPTIVQGEETERIYHKLKGINNEREQIAFKVNGQTPPKSIPLVINKENRVLIGFPPTATLVKGTKTIQLFIGHNLCLRYILAFFQ
jgi:hypothetical protein